MPVHIALSHTNTLAADKAAFGGAAKNLIGSFPDLTFNFNKATPKRNADGSWSADIVVMGTHTGAAFTPMPGLSLIHI